MIPHHILFISHSSTIDGSNRSLFDTLRFMDPNRFSSLVVFPKEKEGAALALFEKYGIVVERSHLPLFYFFEAQTCAQIKPHLFFREWIRFSHHARELRQICLKFHPELVVFNSSCLVPSAFLLNRWQIPFVWHDREVMAKGRVWGSVSRALTRWMARSAELVIPASNFAAGVFNGTQNIRPIHGGVNLDFFSPSCDPREAKESLGFSAETPIVGFFGRLSEEKGFPIFVKAVLLVLRSIPHLRVIAVGEAPPRVSTLLSDLKLRDTFLVTGFCEEVRPFLNAMDVAVFPPSKPESFGQALAEAMAMEKAVIEADSGPAREIVEDGRSGILVPPCDPVRLAEAIVKLLRNPDLRKRLGKEARERIREKFDIRKLALETQAVYEEVIESVHLDKAVYTVPVQIGEEVKG